MHLHAVEDSSDWAVKHEKEMTARYSYLKGRMKDGNPTVDDSLQMMQLALAS